MSIRHKFYSRVFKPEFATDNAILSTVPYKPRVMFLGTFNPDTATNFADFFYGRNFFWTGFKNLFCNDPIAIPGRRMPPNGIPPAILNPSLQEIWKLCAKLQLTFGDLILEVMHNNAEYEVLANRNVLFNGLQYNLIQDALRENVGGLQQLDQLNRVNWNTQNIIDYLCKNPQIETVYFTRRPTGIWQEPWEAIRNHQCNKGRLFTNIFTPSGAGAPVYHNMGRLLHHWVHNNNPNFGKLDTAWLTSHGVITERF
jgi:hypothetical protein